ncbi:hypothetical protein S40285_08555 [Stachybotrys chlorohalonatus IBT 40285]|uniref:Gpi-anchored protein n=1 Tax=Stachybotrys chlorohalonatus (strain IBT 40285) TaxID=1283841 RepID=A0A084Q7R4_STAC4|nr:hypothetical protein S40285_08555 [Stachybotrys chlorohalonata IBT 40285]
MRLRELAFLAVAVSPTLADAQSPAVATFLPAAFLFKRQSCPSNTFECPTSLGAVFEDICCANGQTCAFDEDNQPACCPAGTICTGTAPDSPPTAFPTAPVSYVPNTYFSFPYAATTYPNSAACESAVSVCSRNYEVCTSGLGGGSGFAVTIDVPGGGGVTVDGTGANLGPAVTSVCSSLSSEACSDMEATSCDTFGPDSASATTRTGLGLVMVFLLGSVSVLMP